MAHLRTYKSFNISEIEEIESRIFCPVVNTENVLKGCPGSTNIPNTIYESTLGAFYHRTLGEDSEVNWEAVKVITIIVTCY